MIRKLSLSVLLLSLASTAWAAADLSLIPASLTVSSNTFTLAVRVNTDGAATNAVQAELLFPPNLLSVQSIDNTGSAYNVVVPDAISPDSVTIARGSIGGVAGDLLIAKVIFRVLNNGLANITFGDTSMVLTVQTVDITGNKMGGIYRLDVGDRVKPSAPR